MKIDIQDKELKNYLVTLYFSDDLNETENNFILKNYIQNKDEKERKEKEKILIEGNLKKVINVAIKYRTPELNLIELIREGNKGLIYAVKNWTPDISENFTNYIYWNIEGFILNYIIKKEKELEKK
jgi:DNA-directed RNA polymerase sigma subunit (sigma70/sigma32)